MVGARRKTPVTPSRAAEIRLKRSMHNEIPFQTNANLPSQKWEFCKPKWPLLGRGRQFSMRPTVTGLVGSTLEPDRNAPRVGPHKCVSVLGGRGRSRTTRWRASDNNRSQPRRFSASRSCEYQLDSHVHLRPLRAVALNLTVAKPTQPTREADLQETDGDVLFEPRGLLMSRPLQVLRDAVHLVIVRAIGEC